MKKRLFLTVLLLPLSLTSCDKTFDWSAYENSDQSFSLASKALMNYSYSKYKCYKLDKSYDRLEKIVINNRNTSSFLYHYDKKNEMFKKLLDCINFSQVLYYSNPTDENKQKYDMYYADYYSFKKREASLYSLVARCDQKFRDVVFGNNFSKEAAIEYVTANFNPSSYDSEKEMDDLAIEISNLRVDKELSIDEYIDKAAELYVSYVKSANEFAKAKNYDNYLEYSYPNDYGRSYSYSDAFKVVNFTKQYLVPFYKSITPLNLPADLDTTYFNALRKYNFCNSDSKAYALMDSYSHDIGGSYKTYYNHLWNNGYYCFSNNPNSLSTAYVASLSSINDYVVYFSANNQDTLSVIHEFGHYNALRSSSRRNSSYDVLETHSQGNEYTFLNYLKNLEVDKNEHTVLKLFGDYTFLNNTRYVILCSGIAEIENYAYLEQDLTKEKLLNKVDEIIDSYEGTYRRDYWCYPVIASSCYYISYATSLLTSLQFYIKDFDDARYSYLSFVYECDDLTDEILSPYGLTSPFNEETYVSILKCLEDIKGEY